MDRQRKTDARRQGWKPRRFAWWQCDRYRKIEPLAIGLHKSLASLIERLLQQTGGISK